MSCSHKTIHNHSVLRDDGIRVWRCSHCGRQERWSETWSYWGNIECRECQTASMDWVACSPECATALNGGTPPKKIDDRPRKPRERKPRERRMTMREKAAAYDRLVAEGKVPL